MIVLIGEIPAFHLPGCKRYEIGMYVRIEPGEARLTQRLQDKHSKQPRESFLHGIVAPSGGSCAWSLPAWNIKAKSRSHLRIQQENALFQTISLCPSCEPALAAAVESC